MGGKYLLSLLLLLILAGCPGDPSAPAPALLAISPATLDFGPVGRELSLVLPVLVRNTGSAGTRMAAFAIDGPDAAEFTLIDSASVAIGPGEQARLDIRFSPLSLGMKSARLRMIAGNNDTFRVDLAGLGTAPLVAGLVGIPPLLDGDPRDPVWRISTPLELRFEQVAVGSADRFSSASNRLPFEGSIRALYTADSLYLLLTWNDPTGDILPDVWELTADGWNRSKPGEDGASLIFPIGDEVEGFERKGCAVSCHATPSLEMYEQGHRPDRGRIDLWHWRAGSSDPAGVASDQWADASTGGRRPDGAENLAEPNYGSSPDAPLRVWGAGNGGLDPRRYLWQPDSRAFDPAGTHPLTGAPWAIGDSIPGWLALPAADGATGVRAHGRYRSDGGWSIEFARALTTGEASDVQFDIRRHYNFSIAVHDRQRKFSPAEYAALPSPPNPSHYGVYLIELIFD